MWERSRLFVSEAGTVILACTVVLWALLTFPREAPGQVAEVASVLPGPVVVAEELAEAAPAAEDGAASAPAGGVSGETTPGGAAVATSAGAPGPGATSAGSSANAPLDEAALRLRHSYGGRLGRWLEPVIAPLGFDWKIGVGLIGAFAAREVFVSTMGVVYGIGEGSDEESVPLRQHLQTETWPDGRRVYTPLVGLSLMVFFALAAQCMSTLAVIKRETASWRWPLFQFAYMTTLAWLASFAVYQGGRLLGFA
jgi:ferrous iron transport protein B